jgi:hypothetical protein
MNTCLRGSADRVISIKKAHFVASKTHVDGWLAPQLIEIHPLPIFSSNNARNTRLKRAKMPVVLE